MMNYNYAFPPRFSDHLDVLSVKKLKRVLTCVLPHLSEDESHLSTLTDKLWEFGIRYVSDFRFVEYHNLTSFGMADPDIVVFAGWVRSLRKRKCHTCGKAGMLGFIEVKDYPMLWPLYPKEAELCHTCH